MKHLPILAFAAFFIFQSCSQQPATDATADATADSLSGWYGEEFAIAEVMPASALAAIPHEELGKEVVIETTIVECCRKKGCWMTVDMGEGSPMRVSFKDYGFFVPLNADGRSATLKGFAYLDTIDVDMLRHFAEDAGKSKEEIEAITEPEYELGFEATGVLIK
ncbi:MAG: DUF4920 domain-containing protein [Flavobacteriales bacterium]|nr:DUF4920 domain-containing protein [Flavobacteriales bacterium]